MIATVPITAGPSMPISRRSFLISLLPSVLAAGCAKIEGKADLEATEILKTLRSLQQ